VAESIGLGPEERARSEAGLFDGGGVAGSGIAFFDGDFFALAGAGLAFDGDFPAGG